ncbi:MAG: autotransporter-associated beta strand repeat-containing protein, partial [Candidatus Absconditabacteria bacterium]
MRRKFASILLLSSLVITFGVYATQLTWDVISNGSTIDDGAGTWKVGVSTFNDGSTSVVWATGSDVIIGNGGVGGIITVSGTVIPNSILFLPVSSNYTLSGGIITLPNANTTITTSGLVSPIINAVLAGTGGLTKMGAGTLTLGGTNTYTGNTIISEGKIIVNNPSAFGMTGSISVASGAVLDVSSLTFSGQDNIKSRTTVANGATFVTTLQTLTYDFESDVQGASPANMQIEYSGVVKVGSISGINGNGAYVYTNSGAQMPVSVLLTKFPSAGDYSVTWLAAGSGTNYRNGMTLRAQPTPYYKGVYSGSRLGYLFQVGSTGNTLKIYKITASLATQLVSATITAPASYTSRRYKARVAG